MRLGLIGAGAVGVLHARAAQEVEGVSVVAVCARERAEAAELAGPLGAGVHTDYRELLAVAGVDAVVVSTPHALHTQMVLDAAAAGVHVLVEKPMATTEQDCDAMVTACSEAGVRLAVGHIQHFLPDKVAAAAAIAAGEIGDVLLVHDYRSTDYRAGSRPGWFFDPAVAGGGAVMNIGGHCIDRMSWLAGSLPDEVRAHTWSRFGVGVETDAVATLTMANGVVASLTITSTTPRHLDEIVVVGEHGTVVADPRVGTVLRRDGDVRVLHEPSSDDIPVAFRHQLEAFVRHVDDGATFPVSLELGRSVVATVRAIYRSASAGHQVRVESPEMDPVPAA
ncbi:Gfo/Idh/MocA family protein [Georgenia subflava]|uniref:Gfo/Idh/MocA family oxidoreductase n=1 Tax=Georgenia subflava TaxID=1622177 RepID=A0A6N7EMP6_9MICO|nr:Gfo/Idh/MocA family oxidoreductase [Georgenia subflava]MPV38147.1 gfo/Idh/MocA family oxidoreductase [Georgenia subflava]